MFSLDLLARFYLLACQTQACYSEGCSLSEDILYQLLSCEKHLITGGKNNFAFRLLFSCVHRNGSN